MIVSQIAAMSKNRVIGKDNHLPWNIPEDMSYFREKVKNHCTVMGRKTLLAMGNKPLDQSLNVVITRQEALQVPNVEVKHSVKDAMDFCQTQVRKKLWPEEVFICGGSEIYQQTLGITDRIYLTLIEENYEGDTFFPEFKDTFELISANPSRTVSKTTPPFVFLIYERLH